MSRSWPQVITNAHRHLTQPQLMSDKCTSRTLVVWLREMRILAPSGKSTACTTSTTSVSRASTGGSCHARFPLPWRSSSWWLLGRPWMWLPSSKTHRSLWTTTGSLSLWVSASVPTLILAPCLHGHDNAFAVNCQILCKMQGALFELLIT